MDFSLSCAVLRQAKVIFFQKMEPLSYACWLKSYLYSTPCKKAKVRQNSLYNINSKSRENGGTKIVIYRNVLPASICICNEVLPREAEKLLRLRPVKLAANQPIGTLLFDHVIWKKGRGKQTNVYVEIWGEKKDDQHKDDFPDNKRHLYLQVIKNNILVSVELTAVTVARSGS